ncbi:tetratricopeptide repeat protein [Congregibacter variabilis]|uniref:Tetratricopeptide repeat protein n=1 Tax=Congregibacter variabilis TaxID=3081200 RepID=A0ABZ0HZQ2_9GAMM|nr:tetratricopeptide repeat protein [Congregibacter sp. IMCC43200]
MSENRRRVLWPLLSLLLFVTFSAQAHLPEYFGRKYVLISEKFSPAARPCEGDRQLMREEANRLQDELDTAVLEAGAYNPGLSDPIGELGKLYSSQCNHPAALDAYRKALQIVRVNDGLMTPAQIPYLKALADSYQAIGDFDSAQQSMRSVFRIHDMGQGELDAAATSDSLAYFARARSIFIDPRSRGEMNLFFEAFKDNEHMLEAQLERDELNYAVRESLTLSHLRNLYLLLGTDFVLMSGISGDATSPAVDFMQRSQMLTYGKGRKLLEGLLESALDQPDAVRAMLYFRLGNWQQWNAKWGQACDSYALAWDLAADEDGVSLREQMSQPAELPEDPELWLSLLDPDIAVKAVIAADFRVSARGDISRVDATVEDDGSSGLAARVGRWLRDSHARPAIIDGACVEAELQGRRYRLLD